MSDLQTFLAIAGGCLTLGLFVGAIGMAYGRFVAHLKSYAEAMREARTRLNALETRLAVLERHGVITAVRQGFDPPPPSSPHNVAPGPDDD